MNRSLMPTALTGALSGPQAPLRASAGASADEIQRNQFQRALTEARQPARPQEGGSRGAEPRPPAPSPTQPQAPERTMPPPTAGPQPKRPASASSGAQGSARGAQAAARNAHDAHRPPSRKTGADEAGAGPAASAPRATPRARAEGGAPATPAEPGIDATLARQGFVAEPAAASQPAGGPDAAQPAVPVVPGAETSGQTVAQTTARDIARDIALNTVQHAGQVDTRAGSEDRRDPLTRSRAGGAARGGPAHTELSVPSDHVAAGRAPELETTQAWRRRQDASPPATGANALPGALAGVVGPTTAVVSAAAAPLAEATLAASPGSEGFARELGSQLLVFVREGVQHARLQLNPQDLGPVSVLIQLEGQTAQVGLTAELQSTRQALEEAMPMLASQLSDSGITLTGGGVFERPAGGSSGEGRPAPESSPHRAAGLAAAAGEDAAQEDLALHAEGGRWSRPRGVVDLVA